MQRRGASGSTPVRRSGSPALTVRPSARSSYGGCVVSPGVVRAGNGKGPEGTKRSAVLWKGRMRGPHGNSERLFIGSRGPADSHPLKNVEDEAHQARRWRKWTEVGISPPRETLLWAVPEVPRTLRRYGLGQWLSALLVLRL